MRTGIRQTVFLKGCPLRCMWCHNPEGLRIQLQLMVSGNACTDCGKCRAVCDQVECTACGACVSVCPQNLRRIAGDVMTSGYAEENTFRRVLEKLDFIMMDLKLMDEERHRRHTGVSNERILKNAEILLKSRVPCKIRVPLIPGVSDTEENLRRTEEFIAGTGRRWSFCPITGRQAQNAAWSAWSMPRPSIQNKRCRRTPRYSKPTDGSVRYYE